MAQGLGEGLQGSGEGRQARITQAGKCGYTVGSVLEVDSQGQLSQRNKTERTLHELAVREV